MSVPGGAPFGGKPTESSEANRHRDHHQQRSAAQEAELQEVRDDHGTQTAKGRIGDGHGSDHQRHVGKLVLVQAQHQKHGLRAQVDEQRHPGQPEHDEQDGSRQTDAQALFLFQEFVGADQPKAHVGRDDQVADDEVVEGDREGRSQDGGSLPVDFARGGEKGNGAEKSHEHGDPDEPRVHGPVAHEVLVQALLAPPVVPAQGDHPQGVGGDDDSVDPVEAAACEVSGRRAGPGRGLASRQGKGCRRHDRKRQVA